MIVGLHRNNGYWQARWRDHLGRRHSRGLGRIDAVTQREAKRLCAEIGAEINPTSSGRVPTLEEWTKRYLDLREHELGEGTYTLHELTCRYLVEKLGTAKLDAITRIDAREWRIWLGRRKVRTHFEHGGNTISASTVAMHIRNAKVIFQFAIDMDVINRNPFDRETGTAPKMPKTWADIDDAKLNKILDACPTADWRRLFSLCRWAGLRLGEALRLTWSDIDWQARTVAIIPPGRESTKHRFRTVPLRPELYTLLLRDFADAKGDAVCDGIRYENTHRDALIIIKKAGLKAYSKPMHTLRKCCETEWMARHPVLDVVAWLGNSPTVAAEHYTRPTPESVAKITTIQPQKDSEVSKTP